VSGREDLLLAIDCGTQSVRALLFDPHGRLVGVGKQPLRDYRTPHPGWHEHDGELFWQSAAQACQALWAGNADWRACVRGVAVTTQRATIMPTDREGRCLRPAITWLDQRRASRPPSIGVGWRLLFGALGFGGVLRHLAGEAELNWIAQHEPELHRAAHKFVLVSGLLNQRLTGRFVDSVGSQVGYLPFDFKRLQWSRPGDWKWQALAVAPEQLPELAPVGSLIGAVTAGAAAATGIPAGTPVIAAAADKACEILGSGCLTPEIGALSYGTTATINVTTPRYFESTFGNPAYPAAVPAHHSVEVQIFRGYWMVNWFKEQFGQAECAAAERLGVPPESLFDELVGTVPPGSMGLMLQPYWSPGVRQPGPTAKGAVIGFGDVHTRAHLYRAILEGLAYALRDGRERIERRGGVRLTQLRVSGGGSQSDAAMQLTADVFNLPTARPHTYETSGLGAAIDCAVGLGLYRQFPDAVAAMTRIDRVFEPVEGSAAIYDALYRRVYRHMYGRLEPLYAEIQRITGYPQLP
jgi:sugar (pentulose or hexulose) kinase